MNNDSIAKRGMYILSGSNTSSNGGSVSESVREWWFKSGLTGSGRERQDSHVTYSGGVGRLSSHKPEYITRSFRLRGKISDAEKENQTRGGG